MSPRVTVRALATLADAAPKDGSVELWPDATVGELAARLDLAWERIGTALRNGRPAEPETRLAPDDVVSFIPPISGG